MNNFFASEYKMFIICIISSFVLALIAGPILIPILKKMKFGQNIRDDGPQSHLKKAGIPTIGGLIFIIPAVIVSMSFSKDKDMLLALVTTLLYGAIGFADDYIKIAKKRSLGLKAWQKILAQLAAALFLGYIAGGTNQTGTEILVPFTGKFFDLGMFYIPFIVFIILGTVNSVNLTDGLDGLAGGITIVVLGFFCSNFTGHKKSWNFSFLRFFYRSHIRILKIQFSSGSSFYGGYRLLGFGRCCCFLSCYYETAAFSGYCRSYIRSRSPIRYYSGRAF